ncbi:MAG: nickel-type superoxide dismutase maturation protease [Moorea sp. SIO4A3]|nr:nickel-type superoxide dismutase maturation protease [Moorena sp. SIO4A3]
MLVTKNSIPELILWILRKRLRFRVTGGSMIPLLKPGEEILIDPRAYRHMPPKVGDIVVARHPYQNQLRLVKRVTLVLEDGRCFLQGDNRLESTDSRSFGLVDAQQIIGKVTSRFF